MNSIRLVLFLALGAAHTYEDPVPALVAKLQQRYASATTVSADFRQNYRAPGVDVSESGTFWMKKPGLMRWEYREPETKLFVADGRDTYLYNPRDRQVMVRRFSAAELHSTPLQFLLGRGDILEKFSASREPDSTARIQGTISLRLVPREADPDYSYFVLEFDQKTFDLRRILIGERIGNTSQFILTNVATNVKVDSRKFEFKIPKGAEVIRLDEK